MRRSVSNAGASNAGRSLCVQISREPSYPCQCIDTTRKAIDCATTLPLSFYIMKLCSRLFILCRNYPQDDKFRHFIPILKTLGARRTLVDSSLESTYRVLEFLLSVFELLFSISYGLRATRQNVSKLAAFRRR